MLTLSLFSPLCSKTTLLYAIIVLGFHFFQTAHERVRNGFILLYRCVHTHQMINRLLVI